MKKYVVGSLALSLILILMLLPAGASVARTQPPPAPAAEPSLSSGSLTARVRTHPFGISFSCSRKTLLDTFCAPEGLYAPLAFSIDPVPPWGGQPDPPPPGSWQRATDVLSWRRSGGILYLDVATDDPSGRTLSVVVAPQTNGSITVRAEPGAGTGAPVTTMAAAFATGDDEHYMGFGERENAVDQAGRTVESWAVEGAFNPVEVPFVPLAAEPWAISGRDDATYFPMPWFVSSRGYGFLLENTERSLFRLGTDRTDAWAVTADAPRIGYRVFAGPKPLDVVRRFSAATGRQPAPAAPWLFGPWWQPTGPDRDSLPAHRSTIATRSSTTALPGFTGPPPGSRWSRSSGRDIRVRPPTAR